MAHSRGRVVRLVAYSAFLPVLLGAIVLGAFSDGCTGDVLDTVDTCSEASDLANALLYVAWLLVIVSLVSALVDGARALERRWHAKQRPSQ